MNREETYWHHCGRCGALFQAAVEHSDGWECPSCGQHPVPNPVDALVPMRAAVGSIQKVKLPPPPERNPRELRKRQLILKVFVGWLVLIALILLAARWLWGDDPKSSTTMPDGQRDSAEMSLGEQDQALLEEALPACREVLEAFLAADQDEKRLAMVLEPERVAKRLQAYYGGHQPITAATGGMLSLSATVVHLPEGKTLLAQWEIPTQGLRFDTAFRRVDEAWRLDWEHFVRYSDQDWALFLAGSGPDEAEFRLLARERFPGDDNSRREFYVMLYAPELKRFDDAGQRVAAMAMEAESADARLMRAAFGNMAKGVPMFQSTIRDTNPQDMIRVRVRVKRHAAEDGPKFEITRVLACHWYASSASGVDADAADAGK